MAVAEWLLLQSNSSTALSWQTSIQYLHDPAIEIRKLWNSAANTDICINALSIQCPLCRVCGCLMCAHSDVLVWVVHHSDEHIEEHHQGDDIVSPKHGGTNKLSKMVVWIHVSDIEVDQTKNRPEKRLKSLKQPAKKKKNTAHIKCTFSVTWIKAESKIYYSHRTSQMKKKNLRWKSIVLLNTADPLTLSLLIWGLGVVVKVQLIQPIGKGQ